MKSSNYKQQEKLREEEEENALRYTTHVMMAPDMMVRRVSMMKEFT